jgi:cytochrome c oxidase subunit 1
MSQATTYRTCPRSGLQFESQAEKLMIANAVAAVVFLLIGGILAVGVVLTRWPSIHWLEADTFYKVLTAHGIDMLIFWIIFFEIAVLYFCSSTLLRCRLATPKIAWLAFALMVIGAVVNNVAVYQGGSSVMMTSYVPMMAAPSFYLGLILFAVGALIGCFVFLRHAGGGQAREDLPGIGAAGDLRCDHRLRSSPYSPLFPAQSS